MDVFLDSARATEPGATEDIRDGVEAEYPDGDENVWTLEKRVDLEA